MVARPTSATPLVKPLGEGRRPRSLRTLLGSQPVYDVDQLRNAVEFRFNVEKHFELDRKKCPGGFMHPGHFCTRRENVLS